MNKLKTTYNGGMPNFLNNFRWHEAGVNEVLAHIVQSMADGVDAMRLYGAGVSSSGDNYLISAGAIFFQGEVFTVPAHTLPKLPTGDPGTYYWDLEETFAAEGLLSFEDVPTTHDCYAIRIAKLKKTSEVLEPGTYVPIGVPRFHDIFTSRAVYDGLQNAHNSLLSAFSKLSSQIGTAYFRASFQNESQVYFNIPWLTAFGSIRSDQTDLKIVNGGVYEINIIGIPDSATLRLYKDGGQMIGSLNLDYELSGGLNIFHLNGYYGAHDIYIQGKNVDYTFEVIVKLVAVDPNPSTSGDGTVIVNSG